MFDSIERTAGSRRRSWEWKFLRGGIVALGLLSGACAQSAKESATFGEWHGADHTQVISANPKRDSAALHIADEKLEEADWKVLEELGPKPVWEKLGALSRQARARNGNHPAATGPAAVALRVKQPTSAPAPEFTVIPLPDGKLRIIYRLRHYGGATVTATVDGGTQRRSVVSKSADLAPLVAALATNVGEGGTVVPLADENALIVTCGPTMKDPILHLLSKIDQAPRQVEITAKMFEVSHDFDFQYGASLLLNRLASDNSQSVISTFSTKSFADAVASTATGAAVGDGSVMRLMKVFQGAGISLDGTFQLMAETGLINVVAAPRMTVAAGQTGYMLAGQELPIQSVAIINSAQQTSTTYKPVGVQLYITPQAMGPDTVKLHAISVVSAVSGFAPLPEIQADGQPSKQLINPIIDSREAETSVTIEDGSTLVFGGLRMLRTTTRESKIPGLGDIPGLGWLFKNHHSQRQMTDLYFFVTPTLLES